MRTPTHYRIQFIVPPVGLVGHYGRLWEVGSLLPPIGLASVAAIAEKEGHTVQIMDAEALGLGLDEIQKEIGRFQPDVVGMPTFATNLHVCHRIAEMAKQVNSEVTVILGGAHVSIDAARCVGKPAIDIGIYGECFCESFVQALSTAHL